MRRARVYEMPGMVTIPAVLLLGVLLFGGCTTPSRTLPGVPALHATDGGDVAAIAEKTLPAVVSIWCELEPPNDEAAKERRKQMFEWFKQFAPEDEQGEGLRIEPAPDELDPENLPWGVSMGSGWVYSADGYIVTNAHVVKDAAVIKVRLNDVEGDDRLQTASLWGTDPKSELAVIKVDVGRQLPTLELGDSNTVKVGSRVVAVGSPFNLPQTVTSGIVSAKGRYLPGESDEIIINDVLQTDAAVNVGNSGGPLLDLAGRVVGVNVAIASPGTGGPVPGNVGIAFAIPADTVDHVVPLLIEHRKVRRGWLGVGINDLTPNALEVLGAPGGGVLVGSTFADTPATKAGLRPRDVITSVDDTPVKTAWDLQREVMNRDPMSQTSLTVIRGGVEIEVPVTLGEMPAKYTGVGAGESKGPSQRADLGITVSQLDEKLRKERKLERDAGVVVTAVDKQSAAWPQVREGDVVLGVNGTQVETLEQYKQALASALKARRGYVILELERLDSDGQPMLRIADIEAK